MTRRQLVGLAALWLLALVLRGAHFRGVDVQETLRADALHYGTLAWSLANRGVYEDNAEPGFEAGMRWPPGYPAFLAPFFAGKDLAPGADAALRAQVFVTSFLPVLVIWVGRRFLPPWARWTAGLLTACCPVLATTPSFLTTESMLALLFLLAFELLAATLEKPTVVRAALGGLMCGTLTMLRSSMVGVPVVAALHLARRGGERDRRRAALVLVAVGLLPSAVWEVRNRIAIAHGAAADSYLARPFAEGIYPDLLLGNANRGYAFAVDPEFPEFSRSISKTLATLARRTWQDPWPNLRWNLFGRWMTLWEYHMIQDPPIHIYSVRHGLFRPAEINPIGESEPLAVLYWIDRTAYFLVVPAVLVGAWWTLRSRRAEVTTAHHTMELLYLLLGYHVLLHGSVVPEPRLMVGMRPVLVLLALGMLARLPRRAESNAWYRPLVIGAALGGWVASSPPTLSAIDTPPPIAHAQQLEERGDYARAAPLYEAVGKASSGDTERLMAAGLLYHYRLHDPRHAIELYRTIISRLPSHYMARYQLAVALLESGAVAEAQAAWKEFVPMAEKTGDHAALDAAPAILRDAARTDRGAS